MQIQGTALENYASKDVKVCVVANPANTNCLVALKAAPSIPRENFTCLTRKSECLSFQFSNFRGLYLYTGDVFFHIEW